MTPDPVSALTGRFDGPPLVAPVGVLERMRSLGSPIGVDVLRFVAQRAGAAGFSRSGDRTCGGAGRFVATADAWLAVNLARDDDLASVPAWLEVDGGLADAWPTVQAELPTRTSAEVLDRAQLLALPVAAEGEVAPVDAPVRRTRTSEGPSRYRPPVVVDLSSLWAGPLCTRLLADRGAHVIKVESPTRPDGARRGPRAFFDWLHAGKELVTLDLASDELRRLLRTADVVVEGSRPRALRQHGILAEEHDRQVWISITGYGRDVNRVAFGDDAAVAGGLVARDGAGPCFVADAVADPLTGVAAAAAATAAIEAGGGWLLDVALARVASYVAGDDRGAVWSSG